MWYRHCIHRENRCPFALPEGRQDFDSKSFLCCPCNINNYYTIIFSFGSFKLQTHLLLDLYTTTMTVDARTAAEITTVHTTRVDMTATVAELSAVTVTG